jgi:HTH-type transcriptional regulator/antitoxin HigA
MSQPHDHRPADRDSGMGEPARIVWAGEADTGFSPDWYMSPGDALQVEIDARGLTQAELANRTNMSAKHINQVIKGGASLSADMALRLERALGIPSHVWNALEANFQDQRTRASAHEALARHEGWLRRFPLRELASRGIFADNDDDRTRIEKLLAFFQVSDPDAYDKVWSQPVAAGFRRSQHVSVDPYATAVWLKLGERSAQACECEPYDPDAFSRLLPTLPKLTLEPFQQAFAELRRQCAAVGVAVEFVTEVKGCRACGAARWLNPEKAMILLSGRYRYYDVLWFAFFHEAAHLLLHPRRKLVVDLDGDGDDSDGQESAANELAASTLVPANYAGRLTGQTTAGQARLIAQEIGVHPGVIAGRLGHLYGTWSRYARLRHKFEESYQPI